MSNNSHLVITDVDTYCQKTARRQALSLDRALSIEMHSEEWWNYKAKIAAYKAIAIDWYILVCKELYQRKGFFKQWTNCYKDLVDELNKKRDSYIASNRFALRQAGHVASKGKINMEAERQSFNQWTEEMEDGINKLREVIV